MMKKSFKLAIYGSPLVFFSPLAIVSCSGTGEFASQANSGKNYDALWNNSFFQLADEIPSSLFGLTINQLENRINDQIRNDRETQKLMKVFAFNLLYQAAKNPYNREAKRVDVTDENLKRFGDFLSDKMKPDQTSNDNDEKKTYNKFNGFIEKIGDFKIKILAFESSQNENGKVDVQLKNDAILGNLITKDLLDRLHLQISFKINDQETNEMVVKNGENIFYRTQKSREERNTIKKFQDNQEIIGLIENQYKYQGSKMFYDIESQQFQTIVLTTNVKYNNDKDTTPSGFIKDTDTNRKLVYFDFKNIATELYENHLFIDLANSAYFDPFLQTNFNNYLKEQKLYVDSKMKQIDFNLQTTIKYKEPKEENS